MPSPHNCVTEFECYWLVDDRNSEYLISFSAEFKSIDSAHVCVIPRPVPLLRCTFLLYLYLPVHKSWFFNCVFFILLSHILLFCEPTTYIYYTLCLFYLAVLMAEEKIRKRHKYTYAHLVHNCVVCCALTFECNFVKLNYTNKHFLFFTTKKWKCIDSCLLFVLKRNDKHNPFA